MGRKGTVVNTESNTGELSPDWQSFLASHASVKQDEISLSSVEPGDRILVKTRNTHYLLSWQSADHSELRTNSSRAPSGLVRIMGCSFGLSSSIRPDALFCGGNLELTYADGEKRWTTSAIEEIQLLHNSSPKEKAS
jgi:hypothetical protein